MKIKIVVTLLLLMPVFAKAQHFKLIKPNIEALNTELEENKYSQNIVYLYLIKNYKTISEKYNTKKNNFPDYEVCAFNQKFEKNILYWEEQCGEATGIKSKLTLPKSDKASVIEWVEMIFNSSPMDIKHSWNTKQTKFGPTDDGAGCYFEIIETKTNTIIDMFCGC